MKKNIKDYKNTKTYIKVTNLEDYLKLVPLLNKVFTGWKEDQFSQGLDNYINLENDTISRSIMFSNYTVYPASDFLEESIPTFKFEIGQKVKSNGKGLQCDYKHTVDTNSHIYAQTWEIVKRFYNEKYGNTYQIKDTSNQISHGNLLTEEGLELAKEEVPEYVECIRGNCDFATVGKIYKVRSYIGKSLELEGYQGNISRIDLDKPNSANISDYKKSNKEAFDAQKAKNQPIVEFPKEGYCRSTQPELIQFLKQKFPLNPTQTLVNKTGVAWNSTNWWSITSSSGKEEYLYEHISKFFKNQPIIKEEDLTGRYLEAIIDNPECIPHKIGTIFKVIRNNSALQTDGDPEEWSYSNKSIGAKFKLMSKDFSPKQEEEYKAGDWVKIIDNGAGVCSADYGRVTQLVDKHSVNCDNDFYKSPFALKCKDGRYKAMCKTMYIKALPSEIPVTNKKETLLEEAKRRYKSGMIIHPAHLQNHSAYTKVTIPENVEFYYQSDDVYFKPTVKDFGWTQIVYYGTTKEWATVVQESPKEVKHNAYGETSYWESTEDSAIYNTDVPHGTKPKLIPIKVRKTKEIQPLVKRKRLEVVKPKRISLNQTIKF